MPLRASGSDRVPLVDGQRGSGLCAGRIQPASTGPRGSHRRPSGSPRAGRPRHDSPGSTPFRRRGGSRPPSHPAITRVVGRSPPPAPQKRASAALRPNVTPFPRLARVQRRHGCPGDWSWRRGRAPVRPAGVEGVLATCQVPPISRAAVPPVPHVVDLRPTGGHLAIRPLAVAIPGDDQRPKWRGDDAGAPAHVDRLAVAGEDR